MRTQLCMALLVGSGCRHQVTTSYLQAAQLDLPTDVQTVVVINRSQPRNLGEQVLEEAEGLATGETPWLDTDSGVLAIDTLQAELGAVQRFQVLAYQPDVHLLDSTTWDRPLDPLAVQEICRQAGCDGVIALEALDSDTSTTIQGEGTRGDRDYTATQHTDVVATFRLYEARTGQILDESAAGFSTTDSSGEKAAAREAMDALPYEDRVYDGAAALGSEYAYRISPHTVYVERTIYGGGELKPGRFLLQKGDLTGAETAWKALLDGTGDPKLRGKLLHNLAVVSELAGDLAVAKKRAERAQKVGQKSAMRGYVRVLERREANDARVGQQLSKPLAVAAPLR